MEKSSTCNFDETGLLYPLPGRHRNEVESACAHQQRKTIKRADKTDQSESIAPKPDDG